MSEAHFKVTGETKLYIIEGKTTTSGKDIHLHFCPTCGSTIFAKPDAYQGVVAVKTGILDVEEGEDPLQTKFAPTVETWTCNRPQWMKAVEGAVQFERSI